jgi:hypothetical protein
MKAAVLYVLTAVATGYQMFVLAMQTVNGAPRNPLHYIAFFGSFVLSVAGTFAYYRQRLAAIIVLFGCGACWAFYAPALVFSILLHPFGFWISLKDDLFVFRDYFFVVLAIASPILLVGSTAYSVYMLKNSGRS